MSEETKTRATTDEATPADPIIPPRRRFSLAWLVPLAAVAITVWMIVSSYLERGSEVKIIFESADGLVSGKTAIKYRSVAIGKVERVDLSDGLDKVVVTALINRHVAKELGEGSRFWVVRPRIGAGGISGLDTLLSGAFIEVDPKAGEQAREFVGLEQPPSTPADAPGRRLTLRAETLGSLGVGSPVLYRDIAVGQVEAYSLGDGVVDIDIYIEENYVGLVRSESKFWRASGVELVLNAEGVRLSTASIESLIRGGIQFETPIGARGGNAIENGVVFGLYDHHDAISEEYLGASYEVIMYYESSVRGLQKGAPIEFRGIKIGVVTDVSLEYDVKREWLQIPVRARLEPARIRLIGDVVPLAPGRNDTLETFVQRGLRATVEVGSLLTGSRYIALDFDGDAPLNRRGPKGGPFEIPTMPSSTDAMIESAGELLTKLKDMPLEQLFASATRTMATAERVATALEKDVGEITASIKKTAAAANGAMGAFEKGVEPGGEMQSELARTLKELASAAASIRMLADVLARQPESLIRGRR